jgi:hypothetical protein
MAIDKPNATVSRPFPKAWIIGKTLKDIEQGMTRLQRISAALLEGKTLTTSKAVNEMGIYELPRIISQLRKLGYEIDIRRVGAINTLGDRVTVCEYRLKKRIKEPREWQKPTT